MTEETIFESTPATPETVTPPVSSPATLSLPPELTELVGTGKKYATAEAALASIPHAQKHISTLEQENAAIKAELEKRRTTEELLVELRSTGIPQTSTNVPAGLDQATVEQLIARTLETKEAQKVAQQNINAITSTFKDKFGDKAEEVFIALAKESGMSVQYLNNLAATSPNAVLKLAGISNKPVVSNVSKSSGSINTAGFTNNTSTQDLSARVKQGASTKDLVSAWKNAGIKVGKPA